MVCPAVSVAASAVPFKTKINYEGASPFNLNAVGKRSFARHRLVFSTVSAEPCIRSIN